MITVRPGDKRGSSKFDWLDTVTPFRSATIVIRNTRFPRSEGDQ